MINVGVYAMCEFKSNGGGSVTIDEESIKIKIGFINEECNWHDIIDYSIILKEDKSKGTFKIKTKKNTYSFLFSYGFNDFRYLYNIFCDNCLMHKNKIDLPEKTDINSMTIFEFSYYHRTTVVLDGDFIRIVRKGPMNVWNHGFSGEKSIKISDITAIQFRAPGILAGYLQFTLPGGLEETRGNSGAITDENAITFGPAEQAYAIRIKDYVEEKMSIETPSQHSIADEIKKYKQLLDENAITQEEFETVKKKLLEK